MAAPAAHESDNMSVTEYGKWIVAVKVDTMTDKSRVSAILRSSMPSTGTVLTTFSCKEQGSGVYMFVTADSYVGTAQQGERKLMYRVDQTPAVTRKVMYASKSAVDYDVNHVADLAKQLTTAKRLQVRLEMNAYATQDARFDVQGADQALPILFKLCESAF